MEPAGVFDFIDEPINKDRFSPIIKDKYEAIKGVCLVKKYDDIYEDF